MKEELKIGLVQIELEWENSVANRDHINNAIANLNAKVDLFILPEMFTTGFTMNAPNCAEEPNGETLLWMQKIAKENDTAVTGSIIVEEDRKFFNRLYFVLPDGNYHCYNKRHTFTLAGEDEIYSAGKERLIVDYAGWRICPLICYDLRFPVWSRNTEEYDLLIYVANWPLKRIEAWDALLKARAIENMSYCAGVNRIGKDKNLIEYPGHSKVYDVMGKECSYQHQTSEIILANLSKSDLTAKRENFKFLNDRDQFILK